MPIVTQCTALGCKTLTMGPLCLEHELPTPKILIRGRPLTRSSATIGASIGTSAPANPLDLAEIHGQVWRPRPQVLLPAD